MNFISTPSPVEADASTGVWRLKDNETRRILRERLEAHKEGAPDEDLCESLNFLLDSGEHDRFVLYCPTSLIPRVQWYRQNEALDGYIELFLGSWQRLLSEHDLRADFIDGDVPDLEFGIHNVNTVVQAAYLAPLLLDYGLITQNTLQGLQEGDSLLSQSVKDAFNPNQEFRSPKYDLPRVTEKRAKWLREKNRKNQEEQHGKYNGRQIDLHNKVFAGKCSVTLISIRSAIEQAWLRGDMDRATHLYNNFKNQLFELSQEHAMRDDSNKAFRRLYNIKVAEKSDLDKLGIFVPNLGGPFYPNLSQVDHSANLNDKELQEYILPVMILYGSTLKGYNKTNSDLDRAVFVKPNVDRHIARRVINSKLGETYEFHLDENFQIKNLNSLDPCIGESNNSHILFGGVWEGEKESILDLEEKLLKPYMQCEDAALRKIWLKTMERDVLQYRLLHHGYESCYTPLNENIFWDEGYRRMAAKLYASHVFLPRMG